jgi:hypothetical protein
LSSALDSVIVYSPMGSGLLTGRMTRERIASLPDDWRKHDKRFQEPELSWHLAGVERLNAVAERYDTTPGAIAVAFTLHNPAVAAAIVGFRRPDQVRTDPHRRRHQPHPRGRRPDREGRTMSTVGFVGRGAIGVRLSNRSWSLPPTRVTVWPSSRSSGSTSPAGASSPPAMMVSDPVSARGKLPETGPSSVRVPIDRTRSSM